MPEPRAPAVDADSGYSREALQSMIERKRHNDAERRREFGTLRKLLRQGVDASPTPEAHPLPFHSSLPFSPDERAITLRKINEIEAQMSSQWRPTKVRQSAQRPPEIASMPRLPTTRLPVSRVVAPAVPARSLAHAVPAAVLADLDFIHEPEFEEAALRFASADIAGAESALQAMLEPGQPRSGQLQAWYFLFDLYRVTGRQDRYDDLGAEFARRLQRSPPQWRILQDAQTPPPDMEGASGLAAVSVLGESEYDWTCPAVLDAQGVASLQKMLAGLPQPWRLSWAGLSCLEPGAVAPLALLVAHWARQPARLQLGGIDTLERILEARTVCGNASVDPAWWALRLDWLRAMRRPDEFELVALDYCVTYEVSPPSWDPPRCDLRVIGADTPGTTRQPVSALEMRVSTLGVLECDGPSALPVPRRGELSGVLLGDAATAALARLEARLQGADLLTVCCEHLERLDFEAAGALANWVAARQREGRTVHLTEVHRLLAALLGALGLATQARITLCRE